MVIGVLRALTQYLGQPMSASHSSEPSFPTSLELKSLPQALKLSYGSNFSSFSGDFFFYVEKCEYLEAR